MAAETSGANSYVQLLRDSKEHVMAFLDMRNEALNNKALSELLNSYYNNSFTAAEFCAALEQHLLRDDKEHVMAFLDMRNEALNNHALSELLNKYYVNSFRAAEFCAELEQHVSNYRSLIRVHEEEASFECHPCATNFPSVFTREMLMRERLEHLQNAFVKEIRRIGASKKVSFVFFTATTAISAAAAAAAAQKAPVAVVAAALASGASVVFLALGKRMNSFLKKNESAVHRNKDIISSMIMGSKISTDDLFDIGVLALRLQEDIKSISEVVEVDVRERMEAALIDKFQELGGKADAYSRHGSWIRGFVLQSVENTCITIHS